MGMTGGRRMWDRTSAVRVGHRTDLPLRSNVEGKDRQFCNFCPTSGLFFKTFKPRILLHVQGSLRTVRVPSVQ